MIFLPLTSAFMGYEIGRGIALAPVMIIEHRLIGIKSRIKKLQKYLTKREELLTPANALKKEIDRLIGIDPANLRLKWTDIDFVKNAVRVIPEKRSSPRIIKISNRLTAMLNSLPKDNERVFNVTYDAIRKSLPENCKTQGFGK